MENNNLVFVDMHGEVIEVGTVIRSIYSTINSIVNRVEWNGEYEQFIIIADAQDGSGSFSLLPASSLKEQFYIVHEESAK